MWKWQLHQYKILTHFNDDNDQISMYKLSNKERNICVKCVPNHIEWGNGLTCNYLNNNRVKIMHENKLNLNERNDNQVENTIVESENNCIILMYADVLVKKNYMAGHIEIRIVENK